MIVKWFIGRSFDPMSGKWVMTCARFKWHSVKAWNKDAIVSGEKSHLDVLKLGKHLLCCYRSMRMGEMNLGFLYILLGCSWRKLFCLNNEFAFCISLQPPLGSLSSSSKVMKLGLPFSFTLTISSNYHKELRVTWFLLAICIICGYNLQWTHFVWTEVQKMISWGGKKLTDETHGICWLQVKLNQCEYPPEKKNG